MVSFPAPPSAGAPFARILRRAVARGPLGRLLRVLAHGDATVFTLHRLAGAGIGTALPSVLAAALEHLRRHRYALVPLDQLLDVERAAPSGAVAFTVDDGYADFAEVAQPLFERFDCPVTLFVTTGPLDGQGWLWWDALAFAFTVTRARRLHVTEGALTLDMTWENALERGARVLALCETLKALPTDARERIVRAILGGLEVVLPARPTDEYASLTWDDVRRCEASGLTTIGGHTVTHPILARCDDRRASWEIATSLRRLRAECAGPVELFAYPNGRATDFGSREIDTVAAAGVRWAFSTVVGHVRRDPASRTAAPYAIPRYPFPDTVASLARSASGVDRLLSWTAHASECETAADRG